MFIGHASSMSVRLRMAAAHGGCAFGTGVASWAIVLKIALSADSIF
jgi:hypothetical protein